MKRERVWLWLEDEPLNSMDIEMAIMEVIDEKNLKTFEDINELMEFLIEEREKGTDLNKYGLIIDIMIAGAFKLLIPQRWTGKRDYFVDTMKGNKAGISFVRDFVLAQNESGRYIWKPPPPIIFVSVLRHSESELQQDIDRDIKDKWENAFREYLRDKGIERKIEENDVMVEYFNKWDDTKILKNILKKYKSWFPE